MVISLFPISALVKPQKWLEKVDILPASLDLAATEVIMYTTPGREFLFREIVKGLEEKYDHILIDCPPSLGIITQNALMASDYVIIPTDGNYFAMKGIEKIHYIIGLLKRKLGAEVRILVYGWGSSTICNILEKREYLGHTINFKTRKHFKDKKSHYVPEDEWTIFENTHEAYH